VESTGWTCKVVESSVSRPVQSPGQIVIVSHPRLWHWHFIMKVDFLALWGAFTGTIAIAIQTRQWWLDRAILKVEANIAIVRTDRLDVVLTISAVNNGRRPVNIRRVGALLAKASAPTLMQDAWVSSEWNLFGGREEQPIQLSADGGHHDWKCVVRKGLKFLSGSKGDEKVGKAYVELTSGKRVFCDFLLLPDDK
jgi:hypothetical protein